MHRLGDPHLAEPAVGLDCLRVDARLVRGEQSEARGSGGAGELHRSQHRPRSRLVDENPLVAVPVLPGRRRPPDPSRIEDLVGVAAVRSAELDAERRLEEVEALGEEGALLGKEGLEGGEIEDALIRLDLPEVRVERPDQGHVAGERIAQVEARAGPRDRARGVPDRGAGREEQGSGGVGRRRARGGAAGREVGTQLQRAHRPDPAEAGQLSEHADVAGRPVGPVAPLILLVAAREDPVEVEAEAPRSVGDAEDAQRDLHFQRPSVIVERHRGFPGRVPVGREVGVVEVERVELLSAGEDLEVVGRPAVVGGVQIEGDEVSVHRAIAAAHDGGGRLGVVAFHADVDGVVVPEDPEAGHDGGGRSLVGRELGEAAARLGREPGRLVGAAVELDRAIASRRPDGAEVAGGVLRGRRRAYRRFGRRAERRGTEHERGRASKAHGPRVHNVCGGAPFQSPPI